MATRTPTPARFRPYRFTIDQYLRMVAAGVLPGEARVELLGGILVEPMTKFAPHNFAARQLGLLLRPLLGASWLLSEEKSLALGRTWRPEPDLAVIRGPNDRYRATDPVAADVGLLIEVAESSYAVDRGVKWRAYAAARVPSYGIVNLASRRVEVYNDPAGRGKSASYREAAVFEAGGSVPVVLDGREVGRIAVDDILP